MPSVAKRISLSKKAARRVRTWQFDTAEAMQLGDQNDKTDEETIRHQEEQPLDMYELHRLLAKEAELDIKFSNTEGFVHFSRKHRASKAIKQGLKKGAKTALTPVSLPVKAILWGQRHWEELMWGGIEEAVHKHQQKDGLSNDARRGSTPSALASLLQTISVPLGDFDEKEDPSIRLVARDESE